MSTFAQMIENITPEIYESLKLAVEIGIYAAPAYEALKAELEG